MLECLKYWKKLGLTEGAKEDYMADQVAGPMEIDDD